MYIQQLDNWFHSLLKTHQFMRASLKQIKQMTATESVLLKSHKIMKKSRVLP